MEFVQWGVVDTVKAEWQSSVRAHILPALQCWLMSMGWDSTCTIWIVCQTEIEQNILFNFQEHSQLEALRVVSYIGCVISLSCLAVAVVFYLFQRWYCDVVDSFVCCILMADNLVSHRKKLFTKNSIRFVHLNLTTTLFLAYLTFVVGIELARGHKVSECGCFNSVMSYWNESATLVL